MGEERGMGEDWIEMTSRNKREKKKAMLLKKDVQETDRLLSHYVRGFD